MPIDTMNQLEMRWVPVTDPNGRTRMEAVWLTTSHLAAHRDRNDHRAA